MGAEPYSVAILLERLLGAGITDWVIDILGSDLSHRFLEKAREGSFGNWALRGMPDEERARNFTLTEDGRHWRIDDRIRRHVRFVQHNLLHLLQGPAGPEWAGFDLILCRNVLIYFSADSIAPMMSALGRCLGQHGWLMVGYSDAIVGLPQDLGIVELTGTIAFRPPGCVPPRQPPISFGKMTPAAPGRVGPGARPRGQASRAERRPRLPPSARPAEAPPSAPPAEAPAMIAAIRALADGGRLGEATMACARAIGTYPLDPRLHFYDGLVAQAAGQRTRAEGALRRAIYLSGSMVVAHYHLGLLLLDGATPDAGRRLMTQVIRLCAGLPEAEPLPESDGLTPRDLIERIEMRLRPRQPAWVRRP